MRSEHLASVPTTDWSFAPVDLELEEGDIHVWLVPLDMTPSVQQRLVQALSESERERAARFRFDRHRDRYVVRQAALRSILARYLAMAAGDIRFSVTGQGKPQLADELNSGHYHFNATGSHDWGMVAIARHFEVGIDIEKADPARADPGVANRFFAAGEITALKQLSGDSWIEGFFNCWTRKEAFVKALGEREPGKGAGAYPI